MEKVFRRPGSLFFCRTILSEIVRAALFRQKLLELTALFFVLYRTIFPGTWLGVRTALFFVFTTPFSRETGSREVPKLFSCVFGGPPIIKFKYGLETNY